MIHGIDRHRFRFLLRCALKPDLVKSFLKDNRVALVAAGAPLDNVPSDPQVMLRVIEGFTQKANQIFGKWLYQKIKPNGAQPIPQLILRWRAVEELGVVYDDVERTSLSQQTLYDLFGASPDESLLAFLRTPVRDQPQHQLAIRSEEWLTLATSLLAKDRVAVESSGWTDAVVELVGAVARLDGSSLSVQRPYAPVLAEIQAAIELARPTVVTTTPELPAASPRGIQSSGPELRTFDSKIDYTKFSVIATNRIPRTVDAYLLVVEGFVDENGIAFRLAEDDLKRAIPTIGRIILHPDQYDVAPVYGEPNAYEVERFPTEREARVKVSRRLVGALVSVVLMPHSTADAHRIRDYIADYAKRHLGSMAVFVSSDKSCLMPRVSTLQKVLAPDFDWQLDLWDTMDAVELQNGPHVARLGLKSASKSLNCAPLAAAARKLLRIYTERSQAKLSKTSRELLVELFDVDDLRFDEATKVRLKANLDAIARGSEDFNELVSALLQTQVIKDEIERRIAAEVDVRVAERDRTKRELEQLRIQRSQVERRILELNREAEEKAAEVRSAVKRAFEQARDNGIATLADLSLFDFFLNRNGSAERSSSNVAMPAVVEAPKPFVETLPSSGKNVGDVFRRFGVEPMFSDRLGAVIHLAHAGGSPIVLTGAGASTLSTALGTALSKSSCVSITVELGQIAEQHFEHQVAEANADVLVMRQANVSDLSLYARSLLDAIVQRMMTQSDSPPFGIILVDAGGPAALPWPPEILESAIGIELSHVGSKLKPDALTVRRDDGGWLRHRLHLHYGNVVDEHPAHASSLEDFNRLLLSLE
ncbi:hypothetical protein [Peristeroidobacter soli]|uniref:hypothetical protein n=1 Tax=Peristeroidobacter soli TaxID=2497877 RepID=UPI00101DC1B3|nr:hypothetical protein [Peristeroidobacter soli]